LRSTDGIQNSGILSEIFRHFLCVFYRPPELLVFALNHSDSVISNHLKPSKSKSKSKVKLSRYAMQTPVGRGAVAIYFLSRH
jgi:hypothetical protein